MRKIFIKIICISLLLILSFPSYSQQSEKEKILAIIKKFFLHLKTRNEKELKKILCKEINFKYISPEEIVELGEKMLDEKISISEYMIKVTGHNIYKFLKSSFELLDYEIKEKVYAEVVLVEDKYIKEKLYYIKAKITYKEGKKIIKNKKCEIDIIKENTGKYKILGFII